MAADEPVGKVVRRYPQGTGEMELFPSSEGVLSYGELVFPPDSTSRTLRFEREGYQETLTISVLEVPGKIAAGLGRWPRVLPGQVTSISGTPERRMGRAGHQGRSQP